MNINERLIKTRNLMELRGLDAYLVLTEDPHQSEYVADHWKLREFLSGFNGSAGTLLITRQYVGLWTDSRYYLQAEIQLRDTGIELFRDGEPGVPDYVTYITNLLPSGARVGVDGFTLSYKAYLAMTKELYKFGITVDYKVDIAEEIFSPRAELPQDEIFEMSAETACQTRAEKIQAVRDVMLQKNVTHYLVSALDDIAWLTNLRGADIDYNPVFYAYMIITANEAHLYVDPHKLTAEVSRHLEKDGIIVSLYDHYEKNLASLPTDARVYFDPAKASVRNIHALPREVIKVEGQGIIGALKACKSIGELQHMEDVHQRDGVALVRFLCWLDETIGRERITELDVAQKLLEFRKMGEGFLGESFGAISAYGSNAAIVHYEPTIESNATLEPRGLLLLDTGGQYVDGTTDITRTIALGSLTDQEKRDYTLVLKGHIALARAIFPQGTRGVQLDTLARMAMWRDGIDYGHGTGHGVGYCLNVHEGPQRIAKTDNGVEMQVGMITSNEPGIYRAGSHGIRIENLTICQRHSHTDFGDFLCFKTLSLCPIDTRPIIVSMLTREEREWLNDYHFAVRQTLKDKLEPREKRWLENALAEI